MSYYFLKRRLATGLWLVGLLEIILVLLFRYLHAQIDAGGISGSLYTFNKLGLWFNSLAWGGLFLFYLFGYLMLGITREYWVNGRSMTAGDDARDPTAQSAGQQSWYAGSISLIGLLVLVIGLGVALFMYHLRNPSLFEIVEHRAVADLNKRLSNDVAAINERNKAGQTPLMSAIQAGRSDMVLELLANGAEVDCVDRDGRSALYYAIGNPDWVELLLQKGVDVNHADVAGMTPLHWALSHRSKEAVRLLLQYGANVNQRNREADTPLLMAVKNRLETVDLLLMHGANPNLVDQIGDSPLHLAAMQDDFETAQALIAAGANGASVSLQGWTPLHVAALNGSLTVIAVLLKEKVNVDLENRRSQTPLTCAVLKDKPEVVAYLLEHGAEVNRIDRQGNTYLHFALEEQHYDIARMLIQAGADVDIANDAGMTARKLIQSNGQEELLGLRDASAS